MGKRGLPPTRNSYARDASAEVGIWLLRLSPGAEFTLPAAAGGRAINRMAYFVEGSELSLHDEHHDGHHDGHVKLRSHCALTLDASRVIVMSSPSTASSDVEVLVLQGRPIGEPVAHHGPFVMNTQQQLDQAFADYRRTQFGGWPWKDDAVIFPRDKGRFALLNGVEIRPPPPSSSSSSSSSSSAAAAEL